MLGDGLVQCRNPKVYQYHLNFSLSLDVSTCTPETPQTAQSSQSNGSSLQSPSKPHQGTATSSSNPSRSRICWTLAGLQPLLHFDSPPVTK